MKIPKPITIDFETFRIEPRPDYPPKPVGVSIKYPGRAAKYYAWGHPTKNNCTFSEASAALIAAYIDAGVCKGKSTFAGYRKFYGDGILCHHGKFDADVAEVHMGLPLPSWDKVHDTLFMLFLDDPHQRELGLKPGAERVLGMTPDERDAVRDWLLENQPLADQGIKITDAKGPQAKHPYGAYIAYAPGDIVGKYANGDTVRTEKLFNHLYASLAKRGMLEAYDRERRLMPVLLEMERQGVPVNIKQLRTDVALYTETKERLTLWIKNRLKAKRDINLESDGQLLDALIAAKKVDVTKLHKTPTQKYSAKKESLDAAVTDKTLLACLTYKAQLSTCLNTFMGPWLKTAKKSGGLIFTTWNQTKQERGGGARTGRLSSTPNFQNIPREFKPLFKGDEADAKKAKKLPPAPFDLPPLPLMRKYIVPFKGHTLIDRDYSQQELRILAHFDGGELLEAYLENPRMDVHEFATKKLEDIGKFYDRHDVKTTNFRLVYGGGASGLAEALDIPFEEAKSLRASVLSLYPGLSAMQRDMKVRAKNNEPVRTWGGREYYCEPPIIAKGRVMTFEYKLVNVVIQGSAADCTKEAIIRYAAVKHKDTRILLQVHDELLLSVPKAIARTEMEVLRKAMESVEFDVPMLSDGKSGTKSWAEMKPYETKVGK